MIELKIAFENMKRHKFTSVVLVIVFSLATFALFWVFGWGNAMADSLMDLVRSYNGDLCFYTDFFNSDRLINQLKLQGFTEVSAEANLSCILESPKRSDVINLRELTPSNFKLLRKFFQPTEGRFPRNVDEIVLPELIDKKTYQIGDIVYITTSTSNKVLNTLRFKVVGKNKAQYGLITKESMNLLLNSKSERNFLYLLLKNEASRKVIRDDSMKIQKVLANEKLNIKKYSSLYTELDRMSYLVNLLPALKVLMILILFPLAGAVVAAIVWIFSLRRRREIWTYIALGWRDRKVMSIIGLELWLASLLGVVGGLIIGAISAYFIGRSNIWLQFGYTVSFPLSVKIGITDIGLILLFIFLSISLWLRPPLQKVIKAKPFSY